MDKDRKLGLTLLNDGGDSADKTKDSSHEHPVVADALKRYPFFRPALSHTAAMTYYANHCQHCQSLQGDFYLHSEPGGAFFPDCDGPAPRIEFFAIKGLAEMSGDAGQGPLGEAFEQAQLS